MQRTMEAWDFARDNGQLGDYFRLAKGTRLTPINWWVRCHLSWQFWTNAQNPQQLNTTARAIPPGSFEFKQIPSGDPSYFLVSLKYIPQIGDESAWVGFSVGPPYTRVSYYAPDSNPYVFGYAYPTSGSIPPIQAWPQLLVEGQWEPRRFKLQCNITRM